MRAIPDFSVFVGGWIIALNDLLARILIGALPVAGASSGGMTHPTERSTISRLRPLLLNFPLSTKIRC